MFVHLDTMIYVCHFLVRRFKVSNCTNDDSISSKLQCKKKNKQCNYDVSGYKHHVYIKNLEKSKMAIVVKFQFEKSKLRIRLYLFNRISVLYSNKEAQRETTCLE